MVVMVTAEMRFSQMLLLDYSPTAGPCPLSGSLHAHISRNCELEGLEEYREDEMMRCERLA
jgi:hypothetical protein